MYFVNGVKGDKSGVWECPFLATLKDAEGGEHDVLFVSENGPSRGSLQQYFIGKFTEGGFVNYYGESSQLWADHGPDNYASIPYHNDPQGRVIMIGWMSNWVYAAATPTPWRGQMTIPRELALQRVDGRLYLTQQPIAELNKLIDSSRIWSLSSPLTVSGEKIIDLTAQIPFKTGSLLQLEYTLNVDAAIKGKIGLRFSNNVGEFVSFHYYIDERTYEFDRRYSGQVAFSDRFAHATTRAHRINSRNLLTGRILLDAASIEIFADGGLNTFTGLFYPTELLENVQIYAAIDGADADKHIVFESLNVTALNRIWTPQSIS